MKTDLQIQSDVIQELKWDPTITEESIGVSVSKGIVTLTGNVPSFYQKQEAEKATQRVSGVKAVVEKLTVRLPSSSIRDDQSLAEMILSQFRWDLSVPDEKVKVKVESGWVTLSGEVDWNYQKTAAQSAIRNLTGVAGISNNIKIKEKSVEPEIVRNKIREALKRNAEREANKISVKVEGNKAILSGDVQSFAELEDAKWAAWSAPGIVTVENDLHVRH